MAKVGGQNNSQSASVMWDLHDREESKRKRTTQVTNIDKEEMSKKGLRQHTITPKKAQECHSCMIVKGKFCLSPAHHPNNVKAPIHNCGAILIQHANVTSSGNHKKSFEQNDNCMKKSTIRKQLKKSERLSHLPTRNLLI